MDNVLEISVVEVKDGSRLFCYNFGIRKMLSDIILAPPFNLDAMIFTNGNEYTGEVRSVGTHADYDSFEIKGLSHYQTQLNANDFAVGDILRFVPNGKTTEFNVKHIIWSWMIGLPIENKI